MKFVLYCVLRIRLQTLLFYYGNWHLKIFLLIIRQANSPHSLSNYFFFVFYLLHDNVARLFWQGRKGDKVHELRKKKK